MGNDKPVEPVHDAVQFQLNHVSDADVDRVSGNILASVNGERGTLVIESLICTASELLYQNMITEESDIDVVCVTMAEIVKERYRSARLKPRN